MIHLAILLVVLQPSPTAEEQNPHGTLTFNVTSIEGVHIPARLTFTDLQGNRHEMFPNPDADPKKLAVRKHAVYTLEGKGKITVPVGNWNIMASHGIEWSIDSTQIEIKEGGEYVWEAILTHELDTTGWISGDFHLHTLTHSGHGDSNMNERIISLIGENVEFAVATDHNHNTDYQLTIDALVANKHITAVVGNEVSTSYGHLNIFPLDANAAEVDQSLQAPELFAMIRNEKNSSGTIPIIQINHPRWGGIDYFGQRNLDPVTGESNHKDWSWDFDAIEVLNENYGWGFHDAETTDLHTSASKHSVLQDWYNMLNAGHKIAAVGNSDSHTVIANIAGVPRNYVFIGSDDPETIDPSQVAQAIRSGNMLTTTGPFLRMTANGYPMGSTLSIFDPVVDIHIDAQAASWVDLDTVRIIQNGTEVATITVDGISGTIKHLRPRIRIDIPRDCWIVAIAEGNESMNPYVHNGERDIFPLAIANPIYIDADGDGKYTPPKEWAQNAVQEGDLSSVVHLYNEVSQSEQSLLVLASATNPDLANKMVRLGLSSEQRIVKLSACRTALSIEDNDLFTILVGVIDNPMSDRYLAFSAWMACDATDNSKSMDLLHRYIDRFGWDNARRYAAQYPLRLEGDFVREWQVAGYFAIVDDNDRLSNLSMRQLPEPNIMQLTLPKTTTGEPLSWKELQTDTNGYLNLSLGAITENTFAYAKCWLWSPDTREVECTIGSDDACRIWVGDALVWHDASWQNATPDNKLVKFTLQQGWNPVLVKVQNGLRGMGLYFRVMDEDIKNSATPPK